MSERQIQYEDGEWSRTSVPDDAATTPDERVQTIYRLALEALEDVEMFTGFSTKRGEVAERLALLMDEAGFHLAPAVEWVRTVEELASLPKGTVVLSDRGTIACHLGTQHGVVFGDERSFGWQNLALPARVLYRPDETREQA